MLQNLNPTEANAIIIHYFGRSVARTKELRTSQYHVAFRDGTMSVYSQQDVRSMADIMLMWDNYEKHKLRALQTSNL